jgi:hypothetical protein
VRDGRQQSTGLSRQKRVRAPERGWLRDVTTSRRRWGTSHSSLLLPRHHQVEALSISTQTTTVVSHEQRRSCIVPRQLLNQ